VLPSAAQRVQGAGGQRGCRQQQQYTHLRLVHPVAAAAAAAASAAEAAAAAGEAAAGALHSRATARHRQAAFLLLLLPLLLPLLLLPLLLLLLPLRGGRVLDGCEAVGPDALGQLWWYTTALVRDPYGHAAAAAAHAHLRSDEAGRQPCEGGGGTQAAGAAPCSRA
jgi:hypothetical protein